MFVQSEKRSTCADIREGNGEAYYVPSRDFISMPAFGAFRGADHFYGTVFHELTHWSGNKSHVDRDLKNRFGSRSYAAEELQSWARPSCVQSSGLTAISGTRVTLRPGS